MNKIRMNCCHVCRSPKSPMVEMLMASYEISKFFILHTYVLCNSNVVDIQLILEFKNSFGKYQSDFRNILKVFLKKPCTYNIFAEQELPNFILHYLFKILLIWFDDNSLVCSALARIIYIENKLKIIFGIFK